MYMSMKKKTNTCLDHPNVDIFVCKNSVDNQKLVAGFNKADLPFPI